MGLRFHLVLLVLLPTIPALILAVHTNLEQRQSGHDRVEQDAIRVAQLLALKQAGLVNAARQHLVALSRFPEARGHNFPAYHSFFVGMRNVYKDYTDFGMVETNGDLVASSYERRSSTNLGGHTFFQRVLQSRDFSIGTYEPGEQGTAPSLTFGYPVFDDHKRLVRVLYASLELAALNQAAQTDELPQGDVVGVLDSCGVILARRPGGTNWIGKKIFDTQAFSTMKTQREGTTEVQGRDGVTRLCAFTTVGEGSEPGLLVCAGIPLSQAYGQTRRDLVVHLMVLVAVAGIALFIASVYANRYILRPVRALSQSTQRVAAGDLAARTGMSDGRGELTRLAQRFDQMADALQQHQKQNERFQAELEQRVQERTAQLEQSNKELEAFSYSVSHDLRAPLRHIHGYVDILHSEPTTRWTPEQHRLLQSVSDAAKRMGKLIDDLLAFSRMSRAELKKTEIATEQLVREVIGEMTRDLDGRDVAWTIERLPPIWADRALLKQVWTNLLSNALKFTRHRPRAEIRISSRPLGDEWEFCIQDNGAGFDMSYADKLFSVFTRLHRLEEYEGTGIGLANVHRIILRHGGRTWAEGKVDAGAKFYFSLPAVREL